VPPGITQLPPDGFGLIGDPVAVTQPNGVVHLGALAIRGEEGALLVWQSADGVSWSNPPVHVVDYPDPPDRCSNNPAQTCQSDADCGPGNVCEVIGAFPDKPWMDVSRISGRLWLVWRAIEANEGPYCVATSLDGVQWSDCVTPAPGEGAMSVAADGPHSAIVVFEGGGFVVASRCTATGLTVTCTPPENIAPFRHVDADDVIAGDCSHDSSPCHSHAECGGNC
jgi:hypothetical protein